MFVHLESARARRPCSASATSSASTRATGSSPSCAILLGADCIAIGAHWTGRSGRRGAMPRTSTPVRRVGVRSVAAAATLARAVERRSGCWGRRARRAGARRAAGQPRPRRHRGSARPGACRRRGRGAPRALGRPGRRRCGPGTNADAAAAARSRRRSRRRGRPRSTRPGATAGARGQGRDRDGQRPRAGRTGVPSGAPRRGLRLGHGDAGRGAGGPSGRRVPARPGGSVRGARPAARERRDRVRRRRRRPVPSSSTSSTRMPEPARLRRRVARERRSASRRSPRCSCRSTSATRARARCGCWVWRGRAGSRRGPRHDHALFDTAHRQGRAVRARPGRAHVRLRHHAVRLDPPRPRRHLPRVRPPHPAARGARPRGADGAQRHRRRRLDPAQGPRAAGSRTSSSPPRRSRGSAPTWTRSGCARRSPSRGRPRRSPG